MTTESPTTVPFFCKAYRTLETRARNGHAFSLSEIEDVIDADPPTKKAFEEINAEVHAGRDPTISEIAQRVKMPAEFVAYLVSAFMTGELIAMRGESVH